MILNLQTEERNLLLLISQAAKSMQVESYLVGGFVRDRLLGRACKDLDIVCVGDGIELAHRVAELLFPRPRVAFYSRFGTAMIRHGEMEIEFVGARKESYLHHTRKPDVQSGTLEDDQLRRDFTINAMAVSLNDRDFGTIVDPFNGLKHLEEKILQTPLEPGKTFSDDPLRMMRAIRFASQLQFLIEGETLRAIARFRNRIQIVSKERISTELEKILLSPKPSVGFNLLEKTGLLSLILPELTELKGVEYMDGMGHKDNFYHTLEVVDNVRQRSQNVWLLWSALLHDIGKAPTKRFSPETGWTFHGHDALGAVMTGKIFRRLRLPLDHKLKFVEKLVRLHLRPISLTKENISDSAIRRLIVEAGEELDDLMILCESDITSKNPARVARYLENYNLVKQKIEDLEARDRLRNWQPPITGDIIMQTFGLAPGRQVGDLKTLVREAILDGEIENDLEKAFDFLLAKGKEMGLKPHVPGWRPQETVKTLSP